MRKKKHEHQPTTRYQNEKIEFWIGSYGISSKLNKWLRMCRLYESLNGAAHNDQSTKEYSTERDEVH